MSKKRASKGTSGSTVNKIISPALREKGLEEIKVLSKKLKMGHKKSEQIQGKKKNSNNEDANDKTKDSKIICYNSFWESFTTYCIATGVLFCDNVFSTSY